MTYMKSCPFCGGPAEIMKHGNIFSVRCSKCEGQIGGWYWKEEYAVEEWNQRVDA